MSTSNRESILIVDNDFHNLKVLCTFLMSEEYEVRIAKSDEEAESSIEAVLPDLIVIDTGIPLKGGHEFCRRLKNHFRTKSIPIIFTSFHDDPVSTMDAYELGVVDFFHKPLRIEELRARIEIQLKLVRQVRELEEFNQIMMDREERVLELKQEVNVLSELLEKKSPYPEASDFDDERKKS